MDDTTLRSIRILALNSVENPDWESSTEEYVDGILKNLAHH